MSEVDFKAHGLALSLNYLQEKGISRSTPLYLPFLGAFPDKPASELMQNMHTANNTMTWSKHNIHKLEQASPNPSQHVLNQDLDSWVFRSSVLG